MVGMDANTGKRIEGVAYLNQRIRSILSTRLGSNLMHPSKGSSLPDLIDAPMNSAGVIELQLAAMDSLDNEADNGLADFKVAKITVTPSADGKAILNITGDYSGNRINLEGIRL